ncbi:MAG: AEC family transporter, partial [Rhodospirillaceae bacterium]|nr:AEC family transporter [Rhodospirillaceae bacterium]
MNSVLGVTLPFFALIGCGYLAARRNFLSDDGVKGLNTFVFYFALPCLIFLALAPRPFADIVNWTYMVSYGLAGLLIFALGAASSRLLFKGSLSICALQGQAASVGNVGFLALPLIVGVLGTDAALPVVLAFTVDLVVLVPLSIALLEIDRHNDGTHMDILVKAGRGVVFNPFVLSIAAGVAWSATGWAIPGPVESFTELLGKAAAPTALFALGATLAGRPILETMADAMAESLHMSTAKLFIHPLLVWVSMTMLFDIPDAWVTAAVLTAAAPVAGNVYIIASNYDVYALRASTAVLISTAIAVVSF